MEEWRVVVDEEVERSRGFPSMESAARTSSRFSFDREREMEHDVYRSLCMYLCFVVSFSLVYIVSVFYLVCQGLMSRTLEHRAVGVLILLHGLW